MLEQINKNISSLVLPSLDMIMRYLAFIGHLQVMEIIGNINSLGNSKLNINHLIVKYF